MSKAKRASTTEWVRRLNEVNDQLTAAKAENAEQAKRIKHLEAENERLERAWHVKHSRIVALEQELGLRDRG